MDILDEGSIVSAELSFGRHPAIVLSTKKEIEDTGLVHVVAISANKTISRPDDLISVPRRLGMTKKCYVQCGETEVLDVSQVTLKPYRAYGPFLESVKKQVEIASERAKKSTQS